MNHQTCLSLLVSVVLTILLSASAHAETYYVAVNGDDGHSGRKGVPLATIQKAASLARAGDTVIVGGGEYKGHVILQFSGEPEKPIIFKNAPGEKPVLDGEGR